tara:strand:+ start:2117 stop:2326 length:210 start_codon:yes stop_codon:yes gene_type:complete
MNNIELIYASDVEEFFYEDSNEPVQEGDPVGIEWDEWDSKNFPKRDLIVNFDLLNNIYWSPKYEIEEEI